MPISTTQQPVNDSSLLSAVSYSGGKAVTFSIFNPDDLPQHRLIQNQSTRIRARQRMLRQAAGGEATQHIVKPHNLPGTVPIERRIRDRRTGPVSAPPIDLDALAAKLDELSQKREASRSGSDTRTSGPVVKPASPVSLNDLLQSAYSRFTESRTDSSWSGYRTLVKYWNMYFSGSGPDLRLLQPSDLQAFFEGVSEWQSERSWKKNRDLLYALLKTGCPQTIRNPEGMPHNPLLDLDALPVWNLPRDRWFRDRASGRAAAARDQKLATPVESTDAKTKNQRGHRRRNLPLLTVDEFGRVLTACKDAEFLDPLWWECFFCHIWYTATRWADNWRYVWLDTAAPSMLSIDLKHAAYIFTETKAGGDGHVPMPSWLYGRMSLLRSRQNAAAGQPVFVANADEDTQYAIRPGSAKNRERDFGPEYAAIWDRAGVELRKPHELRGVCISYWFKHAPKYRFAATGHSPPAGDVQLKNYVTLDEDFRQAAETFPFPDQHRTC